MNVFLESLYDTGEFTLKDYEMVCKEAWEVYQRAEAAREEASLGKILRSVILGY